MNDKKKSAKLVIPFFLALGVLTVVSFLLPLRPTRSPLEKRNLAEFPEFTPEALVSGSYFDDITTWFSDTFPGREGWIRLSTSLNSLHGHSEIALEGELPMAETVPQIPDPEELPPALPESTEATEETVPETTEKAWGGVDGNQELTLGTVIQLGDTAFNYQGFSQTESDIYASTLNQLSQMLEGTGVRVISAPAPTSVGIMVEPEYLEAMRCAPQDEIIDYLHGRMSPDIVKVNAVSSLVSHNSEYLYFRTDHHWTALGAYYLYEQLCLALDYEPAPLDSFTPWDQGEFEGSILWRSPWPNKLRRDNVTAYIPQGEITHVVYDNFENGFEKPLLDDMTKRDANTKYLTFICSDNPLSVITNDSLPQAPNCILVKDSFGNALAPFLTQNYHQVIVVDYRKFNRVKLPKLAEEYGVTDLIFAPYLTATQSIGGNEMFKTQCGIY